jgi:hypothetical protein
MNNLAGRRERAGTIRELRTKMAELRNQLGDADPPGPAPVAAACGDGVNTGYGPP